MNESAEGARRRLGELVNRRRTSLGLSLSEAARRAGVMRVTWTGIEQRATDAEDYTLTKVEQVLEWEPGSVQAVLAGGEPVEVGPSGQPSSEQIQRGDLLGRWEDTMLDEVWSEQSHPHLTPEQRQQITVALRTKVAELRAIADVLQRPARAASQNAAAVAAQAFTPMSTPSAVPPATRATRPTARTRQATPDRDADTAR